MNNTSLYLEQGSLYYMHDDIRSFRYFTYWWFDIVIRLHVVNLKSVILLIRFGIFCLVSQVIIRMFQPLIITWPNFMLGPTSSISLPMYTAKDWRPKIRLLNCLASKIQSSHRKRRFKSSWSWENVGPSKIMNICLLWCAKLVPKPVARLLNATNAAK